MHYYQFNVADYRKDTTHLSPIEHFIYRTLMDWYYLDEEPIPKKTQLVMRRLGLGSDGLQFLENVLSDFFVETENGYKHERIEQELAKYQQKAENARVNGSKGGRPKGSNKKPRKTQSVNLANPEKTKSKANQEPITNNQISKGSRFTPPSVKEVEEYCASRKNNISAQTFVDFYAAKGWMVGNSKMKDWQACVRTWESRQSKQNNNSYTEGVI